MADAGILGEQDRIELIEGEIVDMTPIVSKYVYVINRLSSLFALAAGDAYLVSTQNPIHLDEYSELQPDIALLRPGPGITWIASPGRRMSC